MGLIPGNRIPERALRADNASFQKIMSLDATTTGPQTNTVASAADPNAWALTLDQIARSLKQAGYRKDLVRNISVRTSPPSRLARKS